MNPTASFLAFLLLGVSGVYGQEDERSARSTPYSALDSLTSESAIPPPKSEILLGSTQYTNLFLTTYPSRSLQDILINTPGVAEVNGNLHVRGSRKYQTGYTLNGFNVLDRYTNTPGIAYIPEALEEVTAHTGAYDAWLGMNGGGVVEMRMREGGDVFRMTAKYLTDDIRKPGEPFLNTYSYGWNTVVGTIEGPLPFDANFFVAGEIHRARDRQPRYVEPMYYEFVQDQLGSYPEGTPLPYPFDIERNHIPNQTQDRRVIQGNATMSILGVDLKLLGSLGETVQPSLGWYEIVRNYYRQERFIRDVTQNTLLGIRLSADVTEDVSVSASLGYLSVSSYAEDPHFGQEHLLYSDSAANAAAGFPGFTSRYAAPFGYSAVYGLSFFHPSNPNSKYYRESRSSAQSSIEVRWIPSPDVTISGGLQSEAWLVRSFAVHSTASYAGYFTRYFTTASEEQRLANLQWYTTAIGYDVLGAEADEEFAGAREPSLTAIHGTAMYSSGPFTATLGLRQQFIGQDNLRVKGAPSDVQPFGYPGFTTDGYPREVIDPSQLEYTPVVGYALPRGSLRYSSATTMLSVSAGLFVDAYRWSSLYVDLLRMSQRLWHLWRVPYNLSSSTSLTYLAQPEKTSLIEASALWRPEERIQVRGCIYKKSLYDQLEQSRFVDSPGNTELVGLLNQGESSIFGVEAGLDFAIVPGITLGLQYAYSDARGRAPDPSDWRNVSDQASPWIQYPDLMIPLWYGQRNRLLFNLMFAGSDESVLSGLHAGLFGRYVSGHPYTLEAPILNMGSAGPWRVGTRSLIDVRSSVPVEPYFSSEVEPSITWDLHLSYRLDLGLISVMTRLDVTNLFDRKNVLNVFPATGSAVDDSWLQSPYSQSLRDIEGYTELYTLLNLRNHWSYSSTGLDVYAAPRQIRFGVEVEI